MMVEVMNVLGFDINDMVVEIMLLTFANCNILFLLGLLSYILILCLLIFLWDCVFHF
jgi:hypothetical protein